MGDYDVINILFGTIFGALRNPFLLREPLAIIIIMMTNA